MKKLCLCVALIMTLSLIVSCTAKKEGKTLVKIGPTEITEGDLEIISSINPRLKAQMASEFGKKKILDNLVEQELFYQAAKGEGLQNDPDVKEKIDIYKKVIISQAFLDKKLKEKAKKYYGDHKEDYEKIRLSHIMVNIDKDDKAALDKINALKKEIEGGKDFAEVAKEKSDDKMTSKRGGDLGFSAKKEARIVRRGFEPILEKGFTMKVGEISGPIKTDKGYHIITVTRGVELEPYEQTEQAILFKMRGDTKKELIDTLTEKYAVTYTTDLKAAPGGKPQKPGIKVGKPGPDRGPKGPGMGRGRGPKGPDKEPKMEIKTPKIAKDQPVELKKQTAKQEKEE